MRILFVSNLFPNQIDPGRGRFNFNQLKALRELGCAIDVVAPLARFPLVRSKWVEEARRLPFHEKVDGFNVYHPRALYLPRSKGAINAMLYERSTRGTIEGFCETLEPDLLWASFAFPDGVAVSMIAERKKLPFVVSLLGSDINLNVSDVGRRDVLKKGLGRAALVLAKSRALKDIVISLGIHGDRVRLDYNGVDHELFRPRDRAEACAHRGLDPQVDRILFVGNFVDVKDIPTLMRAFAALVRDGKPSRPVDLVLLGNGPLRPQIEHLAAIHGVSDRVRMPGTCSPAEVADWMAASSLLCLPSKNEGVPNVVLEALASGLPVVASRVGGTPEIHAGDAVGALFEQGDIPGLAEALGRTLTRAWDRVAVAAHVAEFTWPLNAGRVMDALSKIVPAG